MLLKCRDLKMYTVNSDLEGKEDLDISHSQVPRKYFLLPQIVIVNDLDLGSRIICITNSRGRSEPMGCGASARVEDASQLDSVLTELELFFQQQGINFRNLNPQQSVQISSCTEVSTTWTLSMCCRHPQIVKASLAVARSANLVTKLLSKKRKKH